MNRGGRLIDLVRLNNSDSKWCLVRNLMDKLFEITETFPIELCTFKFISSVLNAVMIGTRFRYIHKENK
jgi:hypothetical protein